MPRAREPDVAELSEEPGLVAAIIRQAISDALGVNVSKLNQGDIESARRYLRGKEWEPLVDAVGGRSEVIRQRLQKRFSWMA